MNEESHKPFRLIEYFAKHRLAAHVLMFTVFLAGAWALTRLNTQLLPNIRFNIVTVTVAWPGASPEEVESAIIHPLEEQLQNVAGIKKMSAIANLGVGKVVINFKANIPLSEAIAEVRDKVSLLRNLPQTARKPVISSSKVYDPVARVIISANDDVQALRPWALRFKKELLEKGIARVEINGAPEQSIYVDLSPSTLAMMKSSLPQLGEKINARSQDVTAGTIGSKEGGRQLRSQQQQKTAHDFGELPIITGDQSLLVHLNELATVTLAHPDKSGMVYYQGKPAVDLTLFRDRGGDTLKSAAILYRWHKEIQHQLPQGMQVHIYFEIWRYVKQRIELLLGNGLGGLFLIYLVLWLFLNRSVAWWVAVSIPISLSAALLLLVALGGSINMISLFAMIMSLGIIVDDTIVIAEQSVTELQAGKSPVDAVIAGAKRMVVPVLSSSLTTMAAFLPLLLLGGMYGDALVAIPRVVICVIFASLVECFLILPMHLQRSLAKPRISSSPKFKQKLQAWFEKLQHYHFPRLVSVAVRHYAITLSLCLASFMVVLGLLFSGYIAFNFFPQPPGTIVLADITFAAGSSDRKMVKVLTEVERAAYQADAVVKGRNKSIISRIVAFNHYSTDPYDIRSRSRSRTAALITELVPSDQRSVSNAQFIAQWYQAIPQSAMVENIQIGQRRPGPPGSDIDISLSGAKAPQLKQAALALTDKLKSYPGIYAVNDNLPFAQQELIFTLRPQAQALGLSVREVGRQLHAAFSGYLVQIFYDKDNEFEVRTRLDDPTRKQLAHLQDIPIVTKQGRIVPLDSVATLEYQQGFDSIYHLNRELTVNVAADVNPKLGNTNRILADITKNFLPAFIKEYSVEYKVKGRAEDQQSTLTEMLYLVIFALSLIYVILAWVSSSYIWPLFVMVAIPFGLEGAIVGHLLLMKDLTLLSLFGFFGLTGIVINDSIILLFRYKELVESGVERQQAIIQASTQRFRAVVLTSVTTIAALTPLLFETSLQAQFLIPMAISICFGLLFATALILIVIPALIHTYNHYYAFLEKAKLAKKQSL